MQDIKLELYKILNFSHPPYTPARNIQVLPNSVYILRTKAIFNCKTDLQKTNNFTSVHLICLY